MINSPGCCRPLKALFSVIGIDFYPTRTLSADFATEPFSVLGTVTLGTANLVPLDSTATFVNGASTTFQPFFGSSIVVGGLLGEMIPTFQVLGNGTVDEVISGPADLGVLTISSASAGAYVSLDGTLAITLPNAFIPDVGQSFTILRFSPGHLTGAFSSIEGQTFNNGTEMWDVVYNNAGGEVDLVAAPNVVPEPSPVVLAGLGLLSIVSARQWHRTSQVRPLRN
jgi:hypothetical protein